MSPANANTVMLPTEPHVAEFFENLIQNELDGAPIKCGFAGEHKGKAMYATRAIKAAEPIWTEKPFVAMQHEVSRDFIDCCEHCFVPLVNTEMEWERVLKACADDDSVKVEQNDLKETIEYLQKETSKSPEESYFSVFNQLEHHTTCTCGVLFCSPSCQTAANEQYHQLLCTHSQTNESPMGHFVNHTLMTNEIFQLAAKVIAKVIMRFVATHDVAHARKPVDMFCQQPWWDVIASEDDLEEGQTMEDVKACYKELLSQTLALFLDGLRDNLTRMEKEDMLNGLSADAVMSSCNELLNVDYFANVVGLFEMNNISLEVDHPLHALLQALVEEKEEGAPEDPPALHRVKHVLEVFAEKNMGALVCCDGDHEDGHEHHDHAKAAEVVEEEEDDDVDDLEEYDQGLYSVDGTALFSGICTMNHSCEPNCTVLYTKDGAAHVFAIKDIEEGEELCIAYIDVDEEVAIRQEGLREYQFQCTCARCVAEENA